MYTCAPVLNFNNFGMQLLPVRNPMVQHITSVFVAKCKLCNLWRNKKVENATAHGRAV